MLRLVCVCILLLAVPNAHAESLSKQRDIREGEEYGSIVFSPDSTTFYTAGDGNVIKVRATNTGNLIAKIDEQERCYTWALATSPDGKTLAASHGYSGNEEGLVRLFDTGTGELKVVLRGHKRVVRSIAFSADGKGVVTCGDDRTLRWWNAKTGEEMGVQSTAGVLFQCDVKSGLIAVAAGKLGVELWDISTRDQIRSICGGSHVSRLSISPEGRFIATSGPSHKDSLIRIWDTTSGELRESFGAGHNDRVSRLAFSPDGKLLASSNLNGRVTLWDSATGEQLDLARGGCTSGLQFSPDGKRLAQVYGVSDSSSGVKLWGVVAN